MKIRLPSQRGFTLIELMIVVAIIGILSSVAIPSFMRYIQKAKTTEARSQLEKMYNAARTYHLEEHAAPGTIAPLAKQFPATIATTPAVTCCAGGGRCAPEASHWSSQTWRTLHFSMDDPHYYRYEFISAGTGPTSRFTARAVGDLDCDGIESTFEMWGAANLSPGHDMVGSAAVYRINEYE